MGLLTLHFDVLCLICLHLSISDVKNLCGALEDTHKYEDDTLESLLKLKISPVAYFGKAFSNPLLLLSTMLAHGVVLSGPKAAEYFDPSFDDQESCWEFFISADTICMTSALHAFQECGIVWDCERSGQLTADHLIGHSKAKKREHKIRLTRARYSTAIDCVLRSGYDCIIFGQGAMSLYPKRALAGNDIKQSDIHPILYRRLGDEKCHAIDFTPYFSADLEPYFRFLTLIATSKQWIEYEGKIVPVKFPTLVFGKIQNGLLTTPHGVENPSPIDSMKRLPFRVYVDRCGRHELSEEFLGTETVRQFLNVGLGAAAGFFGNYTATFPI